MDFEQLRIFLAVAESRSFTKAAESMYISHSTTSRNVAALEDRLGVRLLDRDNRSVRLTAAGELLLQEGRRLLEDIQVLENNLRSIGNGLAGKLSIASVDIYSYELLAGYKAFCKTYPDVILGMYHRDMGDIWQLVADHTADVGITFSFSLPEDTSPFRILRASTERFCLVAPIDHTLALRKSVKLSDLQNTGYISLPAIGFDFIESGTERARFVHELGEFTTVPTIESLFLQIRSGNGVSVVPYPIAYEYGSGCAILELEDAKNTLGIDIFWRIDNFNPSLPLFIKALENNIRGT